MDKTVELPQGFTVEEQSYKDLPQGFEIDNSFNSPQLQGINNAEFKTSDEVPEINNNDWLGQVATPEKINEWKSKGEIGMIEAYERLDKWEMIPYLNAKTVPEDLRIVKLMGRASNNEDLTDQERSDLTEFINDYSEIQARGYTLGGKITNAGLQTLPYMVETGVALATIGISAGATVAKTGAKAGVKASVKAGAKAIAKKSPKYVAGTTVLMLPQTARNYAQRKINNSIGITDKGQVYIQDAIEKPATTLMKAYFDTQIETATEAFGGMAIRPITGRISKTIGKATPKLIKEGLDKLGRTTIGKGVGGLIARRDKIGFNGFLEEMGEERISDLLKTTFDLDQEEGYSFEQYGKAIFPGWENLLVEAGVIGIQGAGSNVAMTLAGKLKSKGVTDNDILNINETTSELEKEKMLERFTTQEKGGLDQFLTVPENKKAFEQVRTKVLDQVKESVPQEQAEVFADLVSANAFAMSNVYGESITEYADKTLPSVESEVNKEILFEDKEVYNQKGIVKTESPQFKEWFRDSKVVDKKGGPLVVYHGTDSKFDTFDLSKLGFSTDSKSAKKGIFFTSDRDVAESYSKFSVQGAVIDRHIKLVYELERAGKFDEASRLNEETERLEQTLLSEEAKGEIVESYISLKNPIIFNAKESRFNDIRDKLNDTLDTAKKSGNDGVIIKDLIDSADFYDNIVSDHFIVFNPNQIKSVDNKGTFSKTDDNIYNQDIKGQINLTNNKIKLFESADPSTIFHEAGHLFINELQKSVQRTGNPKAIQDWNTLKDTYGFTENSTREQNRDSVEKMARAFESYLMEGTAPTTALSRAFSRLKQWLSKIYKSVNTLGVEIDDNVREVFNSLLGGKDVRTQISDEWNSLVEETRNLKDSDNIGRLKARLTFNIEKSRLKINDKLRFISNVNSTMNLNTLKNAVRTIDSQINKAIESLQKEEFDIKIQKELRTTKNTTDKGISAGKYDYNTNKFFTNLRELNKLNQKEASQELKVYSLENEILTNQEEIERRFLAYKAEGKTYGSAKLFERVLEDIKRVKALGQKASNEKEFDKLVNESKSVDLAIQQIEKSFADSDKVSTKIYNKILNSSGNWESDLTALGGKKLMEEFSVLNEQKHEFNGVSRNSNKIVDEIAETIEGNREDALKKIKDMGTNEHELISNVRKGKPRQLSTLDLVDIYNSIKNKKIANDYYNIYGKDQIDALIGNLTEEEKTIGNILRNTVQDYYKKVNQIFIEIYNRDMPFNEDYWVSSSEHQSIRDLFDDFYTQSNNPSFIKSREESREPIPKNAYNKAMKYMAQAEYYINMSLKFKKIEKTFKDLDVKKAIKDYRGEDFYNSFIKQTENFSLNRLEKNQTSVDKFIDGALGGFVTAKIAMNPIVFVKQLGSLVNYTENMPTANWLAGFTKAVIRPKKTFDFVWKNSEYIRNRYNNGYSEALQSALNGVNNLPKTKSSLGKLKTFLTMPTRIGDVGAIIYGGYPLIKHYQKQGMSLKEAINKFENVSLRSQQSHFSSTLSTWQNSKNPLARAMFAFSNTGSQYMRKFYDSTINYMNGDISKAELGKTYAIYGVINPLIYTWIGAGLGKAIMNTTPDLEDKTKESIIMMLNSPLAGLPLIKDFVDVSLRGASGLYIYDYDVPPLSDLMDLAEDFSTGDWIDSLKTLGELSIGLPIKNYEKIIERNFTKKRKQDRRNRKTERKNKKFIDSLTN